MFCSKCGTELPDDSAFCPQCGERVVDPDNTDATEGFEAIAGKPASGAVVPDGGAAEEGPEGDAGAQAAADDGAQGAADGNEQGANDDAAQGAAGPGASGAPGDPGATIELPVVPEGAPGPAPKKTKRTAAIAAVVAVVVVAAVGAGLWWKAGQDAKAAEEAAAKAAWELAHTTQITKISVEAPAFDDAATPIPVQVKGTDLDGNAVDEVRYLKPGNMQVETLAGSYDLSFPAGYITGDGKVYKSPGATQHIEVARPTEASSSGQAQPASSGGASGGSQVSAQSGSSASGEATPTGSASGTVQPASESDGSGGSDGSGESAASGSSGSGESQPADGSKAAAQVVQAGTYEEVDDLEVTDELINEITDLAKQDPDDNGKAEGLKKKASDNHQAAVKAEEERKAAEAEAARVEARKAQIEETARGYVNALYSGGNWTAYVSPKPDGVGSPPYEIISIDTLNAIDEDTVYYEVTFKVSDSVARDTPDYRKEKHEAKTLYFTPDGMIDNNRRIGI